MIDHIGISVQNLEKAKMFYLGALSPLGYSILMEGEGYCGIGTKDAKGNWLGTIWLQSGEEISKKVHLALGVDKRELVDKFYNGAMAAGGKDNGSPGIRPQYHENYYAAFVLDPNGNNIEAVCHRPQ